MSKIAPLLAISLAFTLACGTATPNTAQTTGGTNQTAPGGAIGRSGGAGGSAAAVGQGGTTGDGGAAVAIGGVPGAGGAAVATGGVPGAGGAAVATGGVPGVGGNATTPADLYVSPTGLASNPGTEALPTTLQSAVAVQISRGAAVVNIWVMAGTYAVTTRLNLGRPGTATTVDNIFAVAGTRPIINFTGLPAATYGFSISGHYYHIKGLEIANATDNCINIGGSHNIIEDVVVHNCLDTGIQITVPSAMAGNNVYGAYNTILNCDSYSNADATGENADGFAAKLRIGPGNAFKGSRAWNNSDDGWDLFAANDAVTIDNCWAFLNGSGSAGDGNGFKLGGASDGTVDQGGAVHLVSNCVSVGNRRGWGYAQNNNTSMPRVTTSFSATNRSGDCTPSSMCTGLRASTLSTTALQAARLADGSLPTTSQ